MSHFLTCVCTCEQRAQQQMVITSYLLKLERFEHTPLWSQSSWNTHTNGSVPHGIQYLGQVLTLFVSHFSECSYLFIFVWPLPHMSCIVIHNLKGSRGSMCNLYKQFLRALSSLNIFFFIILVCIWLVSTVARWEEYIDSSLCHSTHKFIILFRSDISFSSSVNLWTT